MPDTNVSPAGYRELSILGTKIDTAIFHTTAALACRESNICDSGPGADPAVHALVKSHPVFRILPDEERGALLRRSRIRCQKRLGIVCHQGDPARSVMLVLDGYLKQSVPLLDGGEVLLDIVKPGDCINELLVLQERSHDLKVTALSPCRLLLFDATQFRRALDRNPKGLLAVLQLARNLIERTTEQLMDLRERSAAARLAKALLRLAGLSSSRPNKRASLSLRLSQSELSFLAGMSREIVNKYLRVWRDAGWVEMLGGTVASVDVDALSEVTGERL
jgi:CRP-like cAMP-binding protein